MCDRCETFEDLQVRADKARAGDPFESLERISEELEDLLTTIAAENNEPEDERHPEVMAHNDRIRRRILEGKKEIDGLTVLSGSRDEVMEQMMKIFGGKAREPERAPTLDEYLDQAHMAVEETMVKIDPVIKMAARIKQKFIDQDFSETAAEQMAAAFFIGTMSKS